MDVKMASTSNANTLYEPIPTEQIYKPTGKRLNRRDLSRMSTQRLFSLLEELEARAQVANSDLVALLLKRDQLHLENDSLRVEVEDILNFNSTKKFTVPPPLMHTQQKPKQRCK